VQVQLGNSPILELPLQSFPQLGEQVWGIVLPTRPDGSNPVLLSLSSEQGPITVYSAEAEVLGNLIPGAEPTEIEGIPLKVAGVVPASGILLKRDPGVPLVYGGFGIALLGGALSLIATRQLWAIAEPSHQKLHVGGLCNRNLTALATELPALLAEVRQA
jgi:cytochrome c biogenesis protein